jgi:hypothetical protein
MPFWPIKKNEDVVDNRLGTLDPSINLKAMSGAMCKPPFENRWLLRELCVLD